MNHIYIWYQKQLFKPNRNLLQIFNLEYIKGVWRIYLISETVFLTKQKPTANLRLRIHKGSLKHKYNWYQKQLFKLNRNPLQFFNSEYIKGVWSIYLISETVFLTKQKPPTANLRLRIHKGSLKHKYIWYQKQCLN